MIATEKGWLLTRRQFAQWAAGNYQVDEQDGCPMYEDDLGDWHRVGRRAA